MLISRIDFRIQKIRGNMTMGNHYFIEENADGKFVVRDKNSDRSSAFFRTQKEAEEHVRQLDLDDKPDVARVRNRETSRRDK
jgi:hypothetical protein